MTVTEALLSEAQRLVYGRRRIIDSLYQEDPDKFKVLQATDIQSISLQDDLVCLDLADTQLYIERAKILKNFWEHRTRTPSYFDYKVWSQALSSRPWNGTPVAALDYGPSTTSDALQPLLGRPPRIQTDKDGVQKLYFVMEKEEMCSCESWNQMHVYRKELSDEFSKYTDIQFKPVCKHLQWSSANMLLHTIRFESRQNEKDYNPRICVYYFDHRRGLLLYRVTYDGLKTKGQWFPVSGWKEKAVYDTNHIPTGICWQTFMDALTQDPPFKLSPYSQSLGALMNSTRSKQS